MEIKNSDSINNIILLKYKVNEKMKKTKIFGNIFVKQNKSICKMIINKKEYDLNEYFIFENTDEIKLTNANQINNISYMFDHCESIISFEQFNISNFYDMSYMFCGCRSLLSLPDISKFDTSKVTNMSCMFSDCESLLTLPDISKWNTSNVLDMSCMFYNCKSLLSLPDISKWNTSKVTIMFGMFEHCKSISLFPDIGKWDISSVKNMSYMFKNCESLNRIPNISNWDTSNLEVMMGMFSNCISLCCGEEILKKIGNFSSYLCFEDCINFQRNIFDKYIDELYEKMVNESEFGKEIIEQIYEEYDNFKFISIFVNRYDFARFFIKYKGDKDKLNEWCEKFI